MKLNLIMAFPPSHFIEEILYNFQEDESYQLVRTKSVAETLAMIEEKDFDFALIDMEFPDGTGLDLKKKMGEMKDIPTIVITEIKDDIQKVLALEYGADDYMVHPFNILELKARIRAVRRRILKGQETKLDGTQEHIILRDDFEFNIVGRKVSCQGIKVDLTGKEFDLLYTLASLPGKIYSREELAQKIWGEDYEGHLRTVDVHIRRLREKLMEYSGEVSVIRTKWGEGYYYAPPMSVEH